MSEISPPAVAPQKPGGATFRVALWVIAGLALVQVAAIAFAVVRKDIGGRELADRRPERRAPMTSSTTVPVGFPPIDQMFAAEGQEIVAREPSIEYTTSTDLIRDPIVRDLMEMGRIQRESGDMQSALENFRRADQKLPNMAEILAELAYCYEALDLREEADKSWTQIYRLGPEGAGELHKIAELKLLGNDDAEAAADSLVTIDKTRIYRHPEELSGEMVTVRTFVKLAPGAQIDPTAVHVRVLFYDLVDNSRVERGLHEGEYPKHLVTEPIDWKDGPEEIIDFVYFRPHEDDGEKAEERRFHGFVVQLFYNDEWQDRVVQPRILMQQLDESGMLAPAGSSGSSRVENSLFPKP